MQTQISMASILFLENVYNRNSVLGFNLLLTGFFRSYQIKSFSTSVFEMLSGGCFLGLQLHFLFVIWPIGSSDSLEVDSNWVFAPLAAK